MPLHPSLLRKVPEAAYLTADNAHRYRPIMRLFHDQHNLHRYWLTLDEVRDHIREAVDPHYTDEQAEQDLRQLIEWNNLTAEQDRSRVRTVDEWLRRRLRYQVTPYGVAFERLLVELEQAHGQGGSLDPTSLESLWLRLTELTHALDSITTSQDYLQKVRRLWVDAYNYFDTIGKEASDYLGAMHRARRDDMNDVTAFLAFKDVLIQYLQSFLSSLMDYADKIQALLAQWTDRDLFPQLVRLLVIHDTAYTAGPDGLPPESDTVRRYYQQQVEALDDWFRRRGGVDILRSSTADAIEMVVRQSQRLMERHRFGISRRRELEELARCFAACRTVDQAGALAGLALGLSAPRHLLGSRDAHQMPERHSVWQGDPMEVPLSRVKGGRQAKARSAPMRDVSVQQQEVLLREMERRRQEAALWDRLFAGGDVNLGRLTLDDPDLRQRLLAVVGRCLSSPDGVSLAPDGSRIRLFAPNTARVGELVSPDGVLLTPQFILRREREGGSGR